jgi:hypothetical protein
MDETEELFYNYKDTSFSPKSGLRFWGAFLESDSKSEFKNELKAVYGFRIDHYLKSVCQTRTCSAGVLQQLSSYFLYIRTYLDRDLIITLADGTKLAIERLYLKPGSVHSLYLTNAMSSFGFNSSYANLPLKN